jgi:hypothetical protein
MVRKVSKWRCGTNGECGHVGDRDPWTRVGTRRLAARDRERISEGIEGLRVWRNLYVFSGDGPNIGCWASFNIYHIAQAGKDITWTPTGSSLRTGSTFPSALPSTGDENWLLV